MKCIFCEQELKNVDEDSIAQPYGGGEVKIRFDYGSRKWDCLSIREQCSVDGHNETRRCTLRGKVADIPMHNWSRPISDEQLEKRAESRKIDPRTMKLAACTHKLGVICDDCFEKKAYLFQGFEKEGPDANPKLRVEQFAPESWTTEKSSKLFSQVRILPGVFDRLSRQLNWTERRATNAEAAGSNPARDAFSQRGVMVTH